MTLVVKTVQNEIRGRCVNVFVVCYILECVQGKINGKTHEV